MTSTGKWWRRLAGRVVSFAADDWWSRSLLEVRYTVLDAEMTGLDLEQDELLSLGAVRMEGTRILIGQNFYTLLKPERSRWGKSVPVHGIRPSDVDKAPTVRDVLPDFFAYCADSILVGHGVDIDRRFIQRAAARFGVPMPRLPWVDTGRVARWLLSRQGSLPEAVADRGRFSLEDLLVAYDIEPPARHHALADAFATAQIWQRQLVELLGEGLRTVRDLRIAGLTSSR